MSEYTKIADEHFVKLRQLHEEKHRIESEIKKTGDLVKAVLNMMPDAEQGPYLAEMAKYARQQIGLTEAIRELLQGYNDYLSATQIKEILEDRGYDFSNYTSNPLSSIHSILKRFKPSEVEKGIWPDGVPCYRWKKKAKEVKKKTVPFFGKY